MTKCLKVIYRISGLMNDIAGVALTFMMSITVIDTVLRTVWSPIVGTNEVVGFTGAIVIGFALPFTTWEKGHVYLEFFVDSLTPRKKMILDTITRGICLVLFAFLAVNLYSVGVEFRSAGEISPTLGLPIYPFPLAAALCCVIECVVFACWIVRLWKEKQI